MNERDSETLAGMLIQLGYQAVENKDDADVVIINTCSVRDNADQKFYGTLGQFKKTKESRLSEDREYVVCVCGCMMQQQHIVDTVKDSYPWVDIIFGTHNIHNFPTLLEAVRAEKKRAINAKGGIVEVLDDGEGIVENLPVKRMYEHKGFVTIMYGCNNFCTYCIVPYTRGREKSRQKDEIIREIKELVDGGCKEVTLLGQNVNSYVDEETTFTALLEAIELETGIERVRFMTSHPKDLSDELIDFYGKSKKLCEGIHLPVQSGSNAVLKRMNRKYTKESYLELLEKLKAQNENFAVSTDIIVGFPGESEEDFEETLDLVERAQFDSAFTFIYSTRKGTPAEKYEDQIPEEIKHERFNRLVDKINHISLKKNLARVGKVEEVLVEGESKNSKGHTTMTGRTGQFKIVNFPLPQGLEKTDLIGKIMKVKVTEANTFNLTGELDAREGLEF